MNTTPTLRDYLAAYLYSEYHLDGRALDAAMTLLENDDRMEVMRGRWTLPRDELDPISVMLVKVIAGEIVESWQRAE